MSEEFGAPREVREKAPGDWVSAADLRSEAAVRDVLAAATPDIPVLGEEGGGERGVASGWLVDPLDGTANFLHGLEAVGVSVGLVEDGVPIVGVVARTAPRPHLLGPPGRRRVPRRRPAGSNRSRSAGGRRRRRSARPAFPSGAST